MKPDQTCLPPFRALLSPLLPLLALLAGLLDAPPVQAMRASTEVALTTPAWWRAYDDPLLQELLASAHARPGLLLRGYVELRVAAARAGIAGRLHVLSVERLQRLERQAGTDAGPALEQARQLAGRHLLLQRAAEGDAEHRLALLALLSAQDPEALRRRVDADLPLPQVPLPLPAAEPRPWRQDDPASLEREWDRQALVDAAERAQRSRALLQAAQLQREAVRVRQDVQAAGVDAAADAEMQWLMQAAQTVGDTGVLALAWSRWLQSGGAALASAAQTARP